MYQRHMFFLGICSLMVSLALPGVGVAAQSNEKKVPPNFATMTDEEIANFSKRSFALTDRNKDGVIDLNEAPTAKYTKTRGGIVIETAKGKDVWIRDFDGNGDGNVILSEYHEKLKELAYAKRNPSNVPLH